MDSVQTGLPTEIPIPQALRPLEPGDILQVEAIEKEAFPTLWPPTPFRRELDNNSACYLVTWSPGILYQGATNRHQDQATLSRPPFQQLVHRVQSFLGNRARAESEEASDLVSGYVSIWFVTDEAHITGIAVRQPYRQRGIGELLLLGSLELALSRRCRTATLEVRVSNTPAQALYEKYGFQRKGVRKGYYSDNREDALVMTTDPLDTSASRRLLWDLLQAYVERYGEPRRFYN